MKKLLAALASSFACGAFAAEISWTGTPLTGDVSDLITEGEQIYGFGAPVVVNGVWFTDTYQVCTRGPGLQITGANTLFNQFAGSAQPAPVAGDYGTLLQGIRYSTDRARYYTVTLANLEIGCEYIVQYIVNDQRNEFKDVVITIDDVQVTRGGDGYGSTFVGRFTADSDTQSFIIDYGDDQHEHLNGLQVRVKGRTDVSTMTSGWVGRASTGFPAADFVTEGTQVFGFAPNAVGPAEGPIPFPSTGINSTKLGLSVGLSGNYDGYGTHEMNGTAYGTLLTSGWYQTGKSPTLTFKQLTVGKYYLVQWFAHDGRSGTLPSRAITAPDGESYFRFGDNGDGLFKYGGSIIGVFQATATEMSFTFSCNDNGGAYQVNGIQLREVDRVMTGIESAAAVSTADGIKFSISGATIRTGASTYDLLIAVGESAEALTTNVVLTAQTAAENTYTMTGLDRGKNYAYEVMIRDANGGYSEAFSGSCPMLDANAPVPVNATSVIATDDYYQYTWATTNAASVVFQSDATVSLLAVGGGGAGGFCRGAGGGAGGYVYNSSLAIPAGTYVITIGAGGIPDTIAESGECYSQTNSSPTTCGGNTSVSNSTGAIVLAYGGGGGASRSPYSGRGLSGGSSGGNANRATTLNPSLDGQGNVGGKANTGDDHNSGGGGGAGEAGADATDSSGGRGGNGLICELTGLYYAGGGGGVTYNGDGLEGGLGGGGHGGSAGTHNPRENLGMTDGADGFGGGGGGASGADNKWFNCVGGRGGCGTVIIRVPRIKSVSGTVIIYR